MITQINVQKLPLIKRLLVLKFYRKSIECFSNNKLNKSLFWIKLSLRVCPFWEDLWLKHLELLFKKKCYSEASILYYKSITLSPTFSTVHRLGAFISENASLTDEFHTNFLKLIEIDDINKMIHVLRDADPIYHPSRFWLYHLVFNVFQLQIEGIENFKRTVNKNYFGWSAHKDIIAQVETIRKSLEITESVTKSKLSKIKNNVNQMEDDLSDKEWLDYIELLFLLYQFAQTKDSECILRRIEEFSYGNPITIEVEGKRISQDLPNTVIEINTFIPFISDTEKKALNIAELGAGFGRVGAVLMQAYENIKYTIIDIPPALYVSQTFLKNEFPEKNIFFFRNFSDWDEVKEEFCNADIKFLLPHQIELIPKKFFNLFINISSMHEMKLEQIENWFYQIDRCTKGTFYCKQYNFHVNNFDKIQITKEDYPIFDNWEIVYDEENELFPSFFDRIYMIH